MKLIAAGGCVKLYEKSCTLLGLKKLYSILNDEKAIRNWKKKNYNLVIDSGAHSWNKHTIAKTGIQGNKKKLPNIQEHKKKYYNFIRNNINEETIFVELDCYDILPEKELDEDCLTIRQLGGKFQYMRVYHPVIDGGSLKTIDKWISEGEEYFGVGVDSIPYLNGIFNKTKDKIKVHGFALTRMSVLEEYPFYSADSTTPLSPLMYGGAVDERLKKDGNMKNIQKSFNPIILGENNHKLWDAMKNFKKAEIYLTKLWKERGVEWSD